MSDAALFATGVRPTVDTPPSSASPGAESPVSELQVHKAAFFFKLERDLERINAFYLQKESDLRARLTTLITKKRRLIQATLRARRGKEARVSRNAPAFVVLLEGFRYFEKDLGKLQVCRDRARSLTPQQFIEINATGFRKILKKWDKRSKSQTKELYLARQVEVQRACGARGSTDMQRASTARLSQR